MTADAQDRAAQAEDKSLLPIVGLVVLMAAFAVAVFVLSVLAVS